MFVIFAFSLLLLTTLGEDNYDRKYDYFNVDHFVNNPRLLNKYLDCFLGQGPCTPIGRVFRQVLPEVIRTACAKCTPHQKMFTKKAIDAFKTSLPENYEALRKKYDPRNKYFDSFERAISEN